MNELGMLNDAYGDSLDEMLAQAEQLFASRQSNSYEDSHLNVQRAEFNHLEETGYEQLDKVSFSDADSWETYLTKIGAYAHLNKIKLNEDPFEQLLIKQEQVDLVRQWQSL